MADEGDRLLLQAQRVRIDDAARQDECVVACRVGAGECGIDFDLVALIEFLARSVGNQQGGGADRPPLGSGNTPKL